YVGNSSRTLRDTEGGGGALYFRTYADVRLEGEVIAGNSARRRGGGIAAENSQIAIVHSVIVDHAGTDGGQGAGAAFGPGDRLGVAHTTFARNAGGAGVSLGRVDGPQSLVDVIIADQPVGIDLINQGGNYVDLPATVDRPLFFAVPVEVDPGARALV